MHQRQIDPRHHLVGKLMHGVGGKNDQLGSRLLQLSGLTIQNVCNAGPVAPVHAISNRREVEGAKQQVWRM